MLVGTIGASLSGNILTETGIYRARKGQEINRTGKEIVRAGYSNHSSKMDF